MTTTNTELVERIEELLREAYLRGHDEGAEDVFLQHGATGEYAMPHKDCKNEGAVQLLEDVQPRLRAALNAGVEEG